MRKALILDTSILCVYLQVPGKETCGSSDSRWDGARVRALIEQAVQEGASLVLPLATVIETGNHIAQARSERFEKAQALVDLIAQAADARSPWLALGTETEQWAGASLKEIVASWPADAARRLSMGDTLIARVGALYAALGFHVELLTGDCQLKSMEPPPPVLTPRRRRG
ncbi:MAG: hypothetical protein U1A78_05160 [Polyangia bacterium]